jgi:hypothetical protein
MLTMSSKKRQRAPRNQRDKNPKPIRITQRDIAILQAIYDYRWLMTEQIYRLFFPSLHRAYERMEALYHNGYVGRVFPGENINQMNVAMLYVLDKRGAKVLSEYLKYEIALDGQARKVKPMFLEHTIAINDVRIAVSLACQKAGWLLLDWQTEAELKANYDRVALPGRMGQLEAVPLVPDSYFKIDNGNKKPAHFFLELDRNTMAHKRFKAKVLAYNIYAEAGGAEKRFSTQNYRVLTVTLSEQRAWNLKEMTEKIGGENRFWFTSLDQVNVDTVFDAPVWYRALAKDKRKLFR